MGITKFSPQDKKWADYQKNPVYVYGPNGILRKYDPTTGDDVVIYDDLPKFEKKPWKR